MSAPAGRCMRSTTPRRTGNRPGTAVSWRRCIRHPRAHCTLVTPLRKATPAVGAGPAQRGAASWPRSAATGGHYFPVLPAQSEFNRRVRWLWGAFELLRQQLVARVPAGRLAAGRHDGAAGQAPQPGARPRRLGRPGRPARRLRAGRGARRVVLRLPPGAAHRPGQPAGAQPGAWSRPPSTSGRSPTRLLDGAPPPGRAAARPRLRRAGLGGRPRGARDARRLTPTAAPSASACPRRVRRPVAALRNRIETTTGEITEQLGLARHRATTFWGLLTRTAATILAHTLLRLGLV